jgi:hypothetical protein
VIAEQYENVSSCAEDCLSSVNNYVHRGTEQISQMIQDRPARSLMVTSLAGFGVGLLLSRLMTRDEPRRSYGAFDRHTAERFGRNLLERVEQAMPTMLRERLGK